MRLLLLCAKYAVYLLLLLSLFAKLNAAAENSGDGAVNANRHGNIVAQEIDAQKIAVGRTPANLDSLDVYPKVLRVNESATRNANDVEFVVMNAEKEEDQRTIVADSSFYETLRESVSVEESGDAALGKAQSHISAFGADKDTAQNMCNAPSARNDLNQRLNAARRYTQWTAENQIETLAGNVPNNQVYLGTMLNDDDGGVSNVTQAQAQEASETKDEQLSQSLPETITDIPTVTVTEPAAVIATPAASIIDTITIGDDEPPTNVDNAESETQEPAVEQLARPDRYSNDPGGGGGIVLDTKLYQPANANTELPSHDTLLPGAQDTQAGSAQQDDGGSSSADSHAKPTDAAPQSMPVYSEWAQQQIELKMLEQAKVEEAKAKAKDEANEQQLAREQIEEDKVNKSSVEVRNKTAAATDVAKQDKQQHQVHVKNFASPDCGAKVFQANVESKNPSALLTASADEYMLSPCTSKVYFAVELCEAILVNKIELANFELFSSSPKEFTVEVGKSDGAGDGPLNWSNIGRFVAKNKRTPQAFDLQSNSYSKWIRVHILSHHSDEYFCPMTLFRVYGTSEIDAFKKEEQIPSPLAASPAAIISATPTPAVAIGSLHKQAFFNFASPPNYKLLKQTKDGVPLCRTPAFGYYNCTQCNASSVSIERINLLVSCEYASLNKMLAVRQTLREHLLQSRICVDDYGIALRDGLRSDVSLDKKRSYFLSTLPPELIGSFCVLLLDERVNRQLRRYYDNAPQHANSTLQGEPIAVVGKARHDNKSITEELQDRLEIIRKNAGVAHVDKPIAGMPEPLKSNAMDVNIFNVEPAAEAIVETPLKPVEAAPIPVPATPTEPPRNEEEPLNWEVVDDAPSFNAIPPLPIMQPANGDGQYSESVFIRLSKRVKILERHMALSTQYLEELSHSYKKQITDLQQTVANQTSMLHALEEQQRHTVLQEDTFKRENSMMIAELESLAAQLYFCLITVGILVLVILLLPGIGTMCYRKLRRQTQDLELRSALYSEKPNMASIQNKDALTRRKSFDIPPENIIGSPEKIRRPSEEAALVLNYYEGLNEAQNSAAPPAGRVRKSSVYDGPSSMEISVCDNSSKRRRVHHSWSGIEVLSSPAVNINTISDLSSTANDSHVRSWSNCRQLTQSNGKGARTKLKTEASQGSTVFDACPEPYSNCFDNAFSSNENEYKDIITIKLRDEHFNEQEQVAGKQRLQDKPKAKKNPKLSTTGFLKTQLVKMRNKKNPVHESTSWEYRQTKKCDIDSPTTTAAGHSSSLTDMKDSVVTHQNQFELLSDIVVSVEEGMNGKLANCGSLSSDSTSGSSGRGSNHSSAEFSNNKTKKNSSFKRMLQKII